MGVRRNDLNCGKIRATGTNVHHFAFSGQPRFSRSGRIEQPRWTMIRKPIGMAVLALTSVLAVSGVHAQESKQSRAADSFMKQAMQGDMAEIQVGKLAQEKGGDQKVKDFGQTLADDHQQNLDKAKSVAEKIGMTPPESVSVEQKAVYNKLSKLSGRQFDREFAQHMVQDHRKDISEFERESKKSGDVASFAQDTLPTLKKHLEIAESINGHQTTGSAHH
jgi:putative membrane protein